MKRFFGWIVLILAVVVFLLVAGGILGTWFGKSALDEGADALLLSAENYLGLAVTGLDSVDETLRGVQATIDEITASAEEIAANGDSPAAVALQATVVDDVAPAVRHTEEVVGGVYSAMQAFNSTLVGLNRTPGIHVPTFTPQLDVVGAQLQQVHDGMAELSTRIAESDGEGIIAATTQISQDIDASRAQLNESAQLIANTQQGMDVVRANLPWYTTLGAIASTILLFVLAMGQWVLIGRSWRWAMGR